MSENSAGINQIQIEYSDTCDTIHLANNFDSFETLGESFMAGIEAVNEAYERSWEYLWLENLEGFALDEEIYIHPITSSGPADCRYSILIQIDPMRAFGDGKHPTTLLCMKYLIAHLKKMEKDRRARLTVIDVGAGTGILSILAAKLGVRSVDAVELSPTAVENAIQNAAMNECAGINIRQGDVSRLENPRCYDIVLANIISDVIMDNIDALSGLMNPDGIMIVSGVSVPRADEVQRRFGERGLRALDISEIDGWRGYLLKKAESARYA